MVCYAPPMGFIAFAGFVIWLLFHRVIEAIALIIWDLGVFAGKALAATTVLVVLTVIVAFVEWAARSIRRHQAARGACLTCPHPCQQAQVPAEPVLLSIDIPVREEPAISAPAGQ